MQHSAIGCRHSIDTRQIDNNSKKSQQKVFWGLNRTAGGGQVEAGVYKVTLTVDGKDFETKKMTVLPDPLFK